MNGPNNNNHMAHWGDESRPLFSFSRKGYKSLAVQLMLDETVELFTRREAIMISQLGLIAKPHTDKWPAAQLSIGAWIRRDQSKLWAQAFLNAIVSMVDSHLMRSLCESHSLIFKPSLTLRATFETEFEAAIKSATPLSDPMLEPVLEHARAQRRLMLGKLLRMNARFLLTRFAR